MRINFLHKMWRIACFIFLALVCSSQVYQSTHLHHFHADDSIAFEVSAHLVAIDTDHTSTHHHHDDSSSHEDDVEHNNKKTAWWKAPRLKSFVSIDFEDTSYPVVVSNLHSIVFEKTRPSLPSLPKPDEGYISYGAIRGPPLLS
jgi:hypothetical protein